GTAPGALLGRRDRPARRNPERSRRSRRGTHRSPFAPLASRRRRGSGGGPPVPFERQTHSAPPAIAGVSTGSFSIRIAVALNSAVPDFGSVASIVSRFVSTSSGV